MMASIFSKKPIDLFSDKEKEAIKNAIQAAEKQTSGEVRVYVEDDCKHEDAIHRAIEIFHGLNMDKTVQRNGTLIYIAIQPQKLAIYADQGIYTAAEEKIWDGILQHLKDHFKNKNYAQGIIEAVQKIGDELSHHFSYDGSIDKNELPDELVFGKRNKPGKL
jgi:uncharacterized membrane protein